jgi:hypothetical protein
VVESSPQTQQISSPAFPIEELRARKYFELRRFVGTVATLSNVRCVRLSAGGFGRSRQATQLSGLCFEFWNSSVPAYVGQWLHQVAAFQFEPQERITGLTFYRTLGSDWGDFVHHRHSRVRGLRIDIAGSEPRFVDFCVGDKKGMIQRSYHENPFEDVVSKDISTRSSIKS